MITRVYVGEKHQDFLWGGSVQLDDAALEAARYFGLAGGRFHEKTPTHGWTLWDGFWRAGSTKLSDLASRSVRLLNTREEYTAT